MQRLLDKTRAIVDITINGAYPQELINRLAAESVPFWNLNKMDPLCWEISMFASDYKRIRKAAKRAMCKTHIIRRHGLPFLAKRFARRRVLIVGMAVAVAAALVMPMFIWSFEVVGNTTVTDREIIAALKELGIGVGTFGYSIKPALVETRMLLKIPELSYMTINVKGGKATVVVRQEIPAPQVLDESVVTDLVATETGVITRMEVLRGKSLVETGQTVLKGQKLVTGIIEHYANDNLFRVQTVRSIGEIYATTWKKFSAQLPLDYEVMELIGEEKTKYALIIGSKRINFYIDSGNYYDKCDKIIETEYLTLPGGIQLPIALERTVERACICRTDQLDRQQAEQQLKDYILDSVGSGLTGGSVMDSEFDICVTDGLMTATAVCRCSQQIGTEVMAQLPVYPDNAS